MNSIKRIVTGRQKKVVMEYRRDFQLIGAEEGCGYAFPCNQFGTVDTKDENYEAWKENYRYCLMHPEEYIDNGVTTNSWTYTEPAVAECSCGSQLQLIDSYMGACQCGGCGQWYNLFGQALIDPDQWRDEFDY